jgi:hypothetical protein
MFRGRVAEWPNASVLKTEVLQGTVGSNPTSSVLYPKKAKNWRLELRQNPNFQLSWVYYLFMSPKPLT